MYKIKSRSPSNVKNVFLIFFWIIKVWGIKMETKNTMNILSSYLNLVQYDICLMGIITFFITFTC